MQARNKKKSFRDIAKYIIFATNLIAILLLLWTFFTWRISPLKTNFFSYIGLFFGIILLINFLYLLLWLFFGKWKLALISFVTLMFCHEPILTYFPLHLSAEEAPKKSIHILTYNVEGFRNEINRKASKHPILEYISEKDADIVCLQEYMISKTGKNIISQTDVNNILNQYPYRSITGLESSGKYHIYGLACFSKYPIEDTQEIVFENSYNGAAIYKINIGDSIVTLANVHLESNRITPEDKKMYSDFLKNDAFVKIDEVTSNIRARMGRSFRKRARQVEKVQSYLERNGEKTRIICGDFNDTPISYAYYKMKGDLKDAYAETGFGPGITYHEDYFLFRIDYIFHSKNLQAYQAKVDHVKYSDHYPLSAYVTF